MLAALVTTRNEADTISELVGALRDVVHLVIVVDEASSDGTPVLAHDAGAKVLTWTGGIGPCLTLGWRHAVRYGADVVIQLDAGDSHDPYDAKLLLDEIARGAELVVGSRFLPAAIYSGRRWRGITSRVYSGAWNLTVAHGVSDWTSGYRAFTANALRGLLRHDYWARMHAWQAEVLRYAIRDGLTIREVPISYTAGRSSLRLAHAVEAARLLIR